MQFRISDTFIDSLTKLTGEEQKAVKTTAFDLQLSPANPGMQFHKLDKAKDKNFWSVRVSSDLRMIVHKTDESLLLCYVDHHDPAYRWAKRRKLEIHPKQRQLVERDYNGPARVSGSAGTGKTVIALHRAVCLTRTHPNARVLLTTFSDALASALRTKLRRLISSEPRLGERLEVHAMDTIGRRLYEFHFGRPQVASRETIGRLLQQAAEEVGGHRFSMHFLQTEWDQVVDAWQLETWEAYRDVARLGRRTRLPEKQRVTLWSIFERVHTALKAQNLVTFSGIFSRLSSHLAESKHSPFDFTVVDEAQDVSVAQLRFLASLGGSRPNRLFFAGDLGQRIFQQPFPGRRSGLISAGVPGHCGSITVRHTRSECRPTGCWDLCYPTLTAIQRIDTTPFRYLTDRSRKPWSGILPKRR